MADKDDRPGPYIVEGPKARRPLFSPEDRSTLTGAVLSLQAAAMELTRLLAEDTPEAPPHHTDTLPDIRLNNAGFQLEDARGKIAHVKRRRTS